MAGGLRDPYGRPVGRDCLRARPLAHLGRFRVRAGTLPRPILETADGGRTWLPVGTLGTIDGAVSGWSDRLHGMASGQDDSGCSLPSGTPCPSSGWFLTNDGGQTWHGVPF